MLFLFSIVLNKLFHITDFYILYTPQDKIEIRTHNLPVTSPTRYPLGHDFPFCIFEPFPTMTA